MTTSCKRTLVYPVCRSKPTGRFRKKTKGVKCASSLRTLCRDKKEGTWAPKPTRGSQRASGRAPFSVGTRVRFRNAATGTWTGTYAGMAQGKMVFRTPDRLLVTMTETEVVQTGTVVGRVDSGTAHRALQMTSGTHGLPSSSLPYRERLHRLKVLANSPYESPTRDAAQNEILRLKEALHLPRLQDGYTRAEAAAAVQALADQLHDPGPYQQVNNWAQSIPVHGFWPIIVSTANRFARNPSTKERNRKIYRRAHSIMLRIRDGRTVRQHELQVAQWEKEVRPSLFGS